MNKKEYVSPAITFYDLSLSTELCADCVVKANHAEMECPVRLDDYPYTLINRQVCESYAPDLNDYICYHVPLADSNVFSS